MFEIASQRPSLQQFTQLHTDYMYSFSSHPTCVVTAITKNLCARQSAINKEVRVLSCVCLDMYRYPGPGVR